MAQGSFFDSFTNQACSLDLETIERDNYLHLFGSSCSSSDSSSVDLESAGELSILENPGPQVVGCRKRKQFVPQKALSLNDSNFRGVTITMENRLVNGEWEFHIQSTFSLEKKKKRVFKPYTDSSEEEEMTNNYISSNEEYSWLLNKKSGNFTEKHCASCSAKKTPLWRDAEDGTPLCNACGIRYKKYKMRCETCWHIPKKDEFHPRCRSCGSSYVSPRQ